MPAVTFNPSVPLEKATVQEIQFELIRRTQYNALDGKRVLASLLAHSDRWQSVLLDRLSLSNPGKLPSMGLIKLRDLADNFWNADTLYILTPNTQSAKKLAAIIETEDWGGMVRVHDPEDVDRALGGSEPDQAVVSLWWD